VRSDDVNAYIREHAGEGFTAKDFRTWHGTVLAAVELAAIGPAKSRSGAERSIREAIKRVSEALGNTPAVCRSSYVDPCVLDRYREGVTIAAARPRGGRVSERSRARVERAVLDLVS
jgi:DNA topoisomerase-1